jgi:hypothetical protein
VAGGAPLSGNTYRLDKSRIGFDLHDIKGIVDSLLESVKTETAAH